MFCTVEHQFHCLYLIWLFSDFRENLDLHAREEAKQNSAEKSLQVTEAARPEWLETEEDRPDLQTGRHAPSHQPEKVLCTAPGPHAGAGGEARRAAGGRPEAGTAAVHTLDTPPRPRLAAPAPQTRLARPKQTLRL